MAKQRRLDAVSKLIQGGWGRPKGVPRLWKTGGSLCSTPATPSDFMVLKLLVARPETGRLSVLRKEGRSAWHIVNASPWG